MAKLISIGETLIDFMPNKADILTNVDNFIKYPGGAPANVASAVSNLGCESMIITMLGNDPFGDFLLLSMEKECINTNAVLRTSEANTALAFVSHTPDGERDFLFYRSPSADILLSPGDIQEKWFEKNDILHFCSVDLIDAPCRYAHDRAIEIAKEKGCLISFDVNLRFPLWPDSKSLKDTVLKYIKKADIVKANGDELSFLGGFYSPCLITTMGKKGARYKTEKYDIFVKGFKTNAIDATGAGDSFIGTFLSQVLKNGSKLPETEKLIHEYLIYSHAAASIVVSKIGALNNMPKYDELKQFLSALRII